MLTCGLLCRKLQGREARGLRLSVLSSGSSGNATYIECGSGEAGVLVDAGLSARRLGRLLGTLGRGLGDVGAVLLTHGHGDHTSGVRSLVRHRGIEVLAAPGVGEPFGARVVEPGERVQIGGLEAAFYEVPHDTPTYGLRVSDGVWAVALATDLGEVTEGMISWMSGAEALVLEANHDPDWLWSGPYSRDLKRRVASANGHLSNWQASDAALALAPHGLKDLVLAHLSKTNNSPARACGTARGALRQAGHGGVRVRAAIAGHPTPWIEVGEPTESEAYVYRYGDGQRSGGAQPLFEVE